jgi:hypothetical protein
LWTVIGAAGRVAAARVTAARAAGAVKYKMRSYPPAASPAMITAVRAAVLGVSSVVLARIS